MTAPAAIEPIEAVRPRIVEALRGAKRVLLTGHVGVDGDALGSAVALWHALTRSGVDVVIALNETVPDIFDFIVPPGAVEVLADEDAAARLLTTIDVVGVLDNNSWERLGVLETAVRASDARVLCIDHHIADAPFCPDHLLDVSAAATGVVVFDLLAALDAEVDEPVAEALYVALVNDTGWFRHANTDRRALGVAERLVAAGARPSRIDEAMNYRETLARKRLLGLFLATIVVDARGFGVGHVTRKMMEETGTGREDTEDLVNHVRSLAGMRLAAFVREEEEGSARLSFRSRQGPSARRVALQFGGGGHEQAAGGKHPGPLAAAIADVTAALVAELERVDGGGGD